MEKIKHALITCEHVLEGIESETLSVSSALLQCLKIARLLNDVESLIWLQYEHGGYPRNEEGRILRDSWEIAYKNGRGFISDGKKKYIC